MVRLAIRDDDMNYFTKVDDIEKLYEPISGFPISFAIIPAVIDVSTVGACPDTRGNKIPRFVGDNQILINWLRKKLKKNECDVLLHGINHSYKIVDGKKYAEMEWRKEDNLADEIGKWKRNLSDLLDYDINCFVAPSNKISKYGIKCLERNNLNYSGIVPIDFKRPLTLCNTANFCKRWFLRLKDGFPYPNVLRYSSHLEVNACIFDGYEYLVNMFLYCKKRDYPMVVNVHYWQLRDNPKDMNELVSFVKYAISAGAKPSTLKEIFDNR